MAILDLIQFATIFALTVFVRIVFKRLNLKKKLKIFLGVITALGLYVVICIITYNYIFIFSSPEKAFNFAYKGDVLSIANGKETCFILYTEDNTTYSYMIIPKYIDKYKIPLINSSQTATLATEECFIDLCRYNHSKDYYAMIIQLKNKNTNLHITDNYNSHFKKTNNSNNGSLENAYISYIGIIDSEYKITINGDLAVFSNINRSI